MAADTTWFPFQTQLYVPDHPPLTPHPPTPTLITRHSTMVSPSLLWSGGECAGYGLGVVQDHGSAIKEALHVGLFHMSHRDALEWAKRELEVRYGGVEGKKDVLV